MGELNKKCCFKRVLVTGATGVAGPALVNLLVEVGYRVRVFSRHCLGVDTLPPSIERFQGDILDPRAVSQALKGVDAVCHLAAMLHHPDEHRSGEQIMLTNVGGTKILVDQARRAGVGRFVFFSTINVYGSSPGGRCLTETSQVLPQNCYARSKLEAERLVLEKAMKGPGGFYPVVLRVATVYGPHMKGNYKTLMLYLKMGGFALLGCGSNVRTLVFDRDLARAALLCLEHPQSHGQIYNVTDGEIHSFDEIVLSICRALDRKPPFLKIPEAKVVQIIHKLSRISRLHCLTRLSLMAEKQVDSLGVSGDKLQTEIGFSPGVNLDKGWLAVVGKEIEF